jgi:polysaccharide export outer membrane protein
MAGCTSEPSVQLATPRVQPEALTIRPGDTVGVSFPGAPNLNTTQKVRVDGRIALPVVGEVVVEGMTSAGLQEELIKLYSPQLQIKEVAVSVSSSITVYVTGSVVRPGKIISDGPITALEAVMEAGGFDITKADMKKVTVIRKEEGGTKNYIVNLKLILDGKDTKSFFLKQSDIVYVPVKFDLF